MTLLRSLTVDLTGLNDITDTILGIGALIALVLGWLKVIRPRWQALRDDAVGMRDAVVGRPAIVDSITGEERVPALPGIGVRMAHQEKQTELLTKAVAKLVDQEAAITELREITARLDRDVAILQAGMVERVASKVEQTEMWKTIQHLHDDGGPVLDVDDVPGE